VRPGLIRRFGQRDGHDGSGGCYGQRTRICGDEARRIYGDERRIGFDGRMRIVSALYRYYYIIIIM
jgi:hypothetical protein